MYQILDPQDDPFHRKKKRQGRLHKQYCRYCTVWKNIIFRKKEELDTVNISAALLTDYMMAILNQISNRMRDVAINSLGITYISIYFRAMADLTDIANFCGYSIDGGNKWVDIMHICPLYNDKPVLTDMIKFVKTHNIKLGSKIEEPIATKLYDVLEKIFNLNEDFDWMLWDGEIAK